MSSLNGVTMERGEEEKKKMEEEVKMMRAVWEARSERITKVIRFMRDDLVNWATINKNTTRAITDMNRHIDKMNNDVEECVKAMKPIAEANEGEWNQDGMLSRLTQSGEELARLIQKASKVEEGIELENLIDLYGDKVLELEKLKEYWREVRGRLNLEEEEEVSDEDTLFRFRKKVQDEREIRELMDEVIRISGTANIAEMGEGWKRMEGERIQIENELKREGEEGEDGYSLQELSQKRIARLKELSEQNSQLQIQVVDGEADNLSLKKELAEQRKRVSALEEREEVMKQSMRMVESEAEKEKEKAQKSENSNERLTYNEQIQRLSRLGLSSSLSPDSSSEPVRMPSIKQETLLACEWNGNEEIEMRERRSGRAVRLPPMRPYSGKKEEFDDFRVGFEIRYGQEDTKTAVAMLREVLVGEAKEEYRNIPDSTKRESVKACLDYLESRISEESPFYKIELEQRIREQRVNGRTVAKVCEELEKWVNRLHKEERRREEVKVSQLMSLYKTSPHYLKMLEMFECEESYQRMRDHLIRVEFIGKQMQERKIGYAKGGRSESASGLGVRCFTCHKVGHKSTECKDESSVRRDQIACFNCKKVGHKSIDCNNRIKCFKCGKEGHKSPDCRAPVNTQNGGIGSGQDVRGGTGGGGSGRGFPYTPPKTFTPRTFKVLVNEEIEKEEKVDIVSESARDMYTRKLEPIMGLIGGKRMEAVLDTSAEVSLISMDRVKELENVSLEETNATRVECASGKRIMIIAKCILEVELSIGRSIKTGFHVSRGKIGGDDQVLLGGPALHAMGIGLVELPQGNSDEKMQEKGEKAIVRRELILGPKETGNVLVRTGRANNGKVSVLWSEREEVVDGILSLEKGVKNVYVPVINLSDEEITLKEHDVVGEWMEMSEEKEKVNVVNNMRVSWNYSKNDGEEGGMTGKKWDDIRNTLEKNRGGNLPSEMAEVLRRYESVFAMDENQIGELRGVECNIDMGGHTPIREKPRPVPFVIREQLRQLLDKMKVQGVIEKSTSPWSSPIVIVRKKDGSIRLCIDYRRLNQVIRLDAYPMPHIESTLQSLEGKKIFSSIDLANGFWQLKLSEVSKPVTAFSVLGEHFQFNRLPFGMANSPSLFQREMVELFKDELNKDGRGRQVSLYIDDLLLATETMSEQVELVGRVLERLRNAGLRVSHKKCVFAVNKVSYLGHVVSSDGIEVEEGKVEAIKKYARPKNLNELRSFMGMASYYRRFIRAFASIVQPLTKMMTPKNEWKWTAEAESAFERVKAALCTAPILAQPDFTRALDGTRPLVITTDASIKGVGGVLSQETDEGEKPLAFHSRGLTKSEMNYSIVDLEALAVTECVRKWRHLVFGLKIVVRTDHSPLVTMFKRKNVSGRILRWANDLSHFTIEFRHVKGKENVVADALSRNPIEGEKSDDCAGEDFVVNVITTRSKTVDDRRVRERERCEEEDKERKEAILLEWKREQNEDVWAREMVRRIEDGNGKDTEVYIVPASNKKITVQDCTLREGLLNITGEDHEQRFYVPEGVREKLVRDIHESPLVGHVGAKRLIEMMKREVYWGSMLRDVPMWVHKCEKCALVNSQKTYIPLLQPRVVNRPMEVVGVDLIVMERGIRGGKYILTVIDLFTKYMSAFVIKEKKADVVARMFVDRWVLEGGRVPESLLSDNGGEFLNQIMDEIQKIWKIERKTTLSYHSRANGVTERANRTILETLRRIVSDVSEWEDALPFVVYSYNNTPHSATGESPNFLMYGRDERLPMGSVPAGIKEGRVEYQEVDMSDYKNTLVLMMERTVKEVGSRLAEERKRMSKRYDKKYRHNKERAPVIGDRVYVRRETETNKLSIPWDGPYRVTERSATTATVMDIMRGESKKKVVQLDRLRVVNGGNENNEEGVSVRDCWRVGRVRWDDQTNGILIRSYRRYTIPSTSPLHPDGVCTECGVTKGITLVPGVTGTLADLPVRSLREAAVVWELDQEKSGTKWGLFEATRKLRESRPPSLKSMSAVFEGGCAHRVDLIGRIPQGVQIEFEGGDDQLNKAATVIWVTPTPLEKAVEEKRIPSPLLIVEEGSPILALRGEPKRIEIQAVERGTLRQKWEERVEEGILGERQVIIMLGNTMLSERIEELMQAVLSAVEGKEEARVAVVPPILAQTATQSAIECHERLARMLRKYEVENIGKGEGRIMYGNEIAWNTNGVPIGLLPLMAGGKEWTEIEEAIMARLGEGKGMLRGRGEGEPERKRMRMDGNPDERKDSSGGLRRPDREGCFNCGKAGHISRDCEEESKQFGAAYRGGGRGAVRRGVDRGGRGGYGNGGRGYGVGRGGRGADHERRGGM